MGLVFAILLLGVPLAAAYYDLSKTGNGGGNFKFGELVGINAPSKAPAKSVTRAPALAPAKSEPPVVLSSAEPPAL